MGEKLPRRSRRGFIGCLAAAAAAAGLTQAAPARAAGLPDGRAYELVTPNIGGVPVGTSGSVVSSSGDLFDFTTSDNPESAPSSQLTNVWTATRTASGWTDSPASPPFNRSASNALTTQVYAAPDGLQSTVATEQGLTPGATDEFNVFLRHADGSYALLTPAGTGSSAASSTFSPDSSHVFFTPGVAQIPQDTADYTGGAKTLYGWSQATGLSLVSRLPDGSLATRPASLPSSSYGLAPTSADGSAVLFQLDSDSTDLYLRVNDSSTVNVSAPANGVDPGPAPMLGSIGGVTADGSDVLFVDSGKLTANANTGGANGSIPNGGGDLYDYDIASRRLTDLTPDSTEDLGAQVRQILAVGGSGSYVYFEADGDLAPGATDGRQNLYVEHDGTITFIATSDSVYAGEATPDGHRIAFTSSDPLTGYDNTDAVSGAADQEVFLFDAPSGSLSCVSCHRDGTPPTGSSSLGSLGSPPTTVKSMSDDGTRVFFQGQDALLPAATNGLQNVFEWENGQQSLISAGNGPSQSSLLGTTSSGNDVFFTSHDDLVPPLNAVRASAIYDARVGGGFPVSVPSSSSCTVTGSCLAPALTAPAAPTVATVSFSGPGNATHRRVVRATVTRHRVSGDRVSVRVHVPAAGRLTVSGGSTGRVTRTYTRARTVSLTVTLTKAAQRVLASRGRLSIVVSLRWAPRSGGSAVSTVHVTAVERTHR